MHTRPFIFALLFLASTRAVAADFCAQTDGQFATALSIVELTPGPNRILLGAGKTFHLANTAFDDASYPYNGRQLTIAGGYDATCATQVTHDAASSVLDGTGAGIAQGYNFLPIDGGNSFTLATLTIAHLAKPLDVDVGGDDARLRLQRVRVIDGASVALASGDGANPRITVSDSVFARMSGAVHNAALSIGALGDGNLRIDLVNTTVTASSRNGVSIYNPQGTSWLYNNVLYGNAAGFVDLDQNEPVWAFNNSIGSHDGGFVAGSSSNLATNPLFVSATDYNLQFASPARDSGTSAVPGGLSAYDIEGGERSVGAAVDRGAYENDASGATILLVTNTNDAGTGSLRQAILDSNANPAFNIIGFNIPGACPRTIAVNTQLPAISDGVSIRGYTQPGSSPNGSGLIDNATLCIELVEASGQTVVDGLHFTPAADDDTLDVSGLAIGGFSTGIFVDHTNTGTGVEYSIWGNFIGLAADGSTLRANSFAGIDVRGRVYGTIGGDDDAQRNVIGGGLAGVRIDADATNWVSNNFIGTTAGGGTARPNALGVTVLSGLNYVQDNVISGNTAAGVLLTGVNALENTVAGNRIGVKAFAFCLPPCTPDYALGNGQYGVSISTGAQYNHVRDNTIAYNGSSNTDAGLRISGSGTTNNSVNANRIHDNDGLGIDIGATGVDPIDNDAGVPADAANHGLNAPELSFSRGGNTTGHVFGHLRSLDGPYHIELYASTACDGSGNGEGREAVGESDITISGAPVGDNGEVWFDVPIASTQDLVGRAITALVSVPSNGGARANDTSEFSACQTHAFVDLIFVDGFDPPSP